MTEKQLTSIEIYPKIFVYKNMFKDIDSTFAELKNATGDEDELINEWTPWSHFGQYLYPTLKGHPHELSVEYVKAIKTTTEKQEVQKLAILELLNNFHLVTEDYAAKHGIEIDAKKVIKNQMDQDDYEWKVTGPSIARHKEENSDPIAMTYHSDYIREPITSPGHKFVITALAYFNDDYEGGEIDFVVSGEAYKYKPEAGDFVVFPSGHPDFLTKDGSVYLHGVMPASGPSKYLSRMYWTKYHPGDKEWHEKEEEFGKEVWAEMQKDIMQKFRDEHPNKTNADKERRIA